MIVKLTKQTRNLQNLCKHFSQTAKNKIKIKIVNFKEAISEAFLLPNHFMIGLNPPYASELFSRNKARG